MRGRPRARDARQLPMALLAAAAAGLQRKSLAELTAREIAAEAGTTQAMIQYYFGGKDGLVSALIRDTLQEIAASFDTIVEAIARDGRSPTRRLVETMFRHYCAHLPLYRVLLEEIGDSRSQIRRDYLAGRLPGNFRPLCKVMAAAQAAGIYRRDIDLRQATFVISCLTLGPAAIGPAIGPFDIALDAPMGEAWIGHVTEMIDRMLCVAG